MRYKLAICLVLGMFSTNILAIGLPDFYFESSLMKMRIEADNSDDKYNPMMLRAKSGYMVNSKSAIELQIAGTVKEEEKNDQDISAYLFSLNYRFGAPKFSYGGMYFSAGLSTVRVAVEQGDFEDYEDVNNASIGFGFEERIFSLKNMKLTFDITRFFAENSDDPEISTVALGIRTDF